MTYRVITELGRGGFGIVEQVQSLSGEQVARKRFAPTLIMDASTLERMRKRFIREVKTQLHLGGEWVLEVLDSDLDSESPWFTMPVAELDYSKKLRLDRVDSTISTEPLVDLLGGLEWLHAMGYSHRDLNPHNVLLCDGRWKLADLGAVLPPANQTVTMTDGTVIYTERYCAPEQREDFHAAGPPADVYSFGCILHDVFSGQERRPYAQHSCEGRIGILIEKCTEEDPARRPTLGMLREPLLEILADVDSEGAPANAGVDQWLLELERADGWDEDKHHEFVRFFNAMDTSGVTPGCENAYVDVNSTPFMSRIPASFLAHIASRTDGRSRALVAAYCDWARATSFTFRFADTICSRICSLYDNSRDMAIKGAAFIALVCLGSSHNRWHVMRAAMTRAADAAQDELLALRLAMDIKIEEMQAPFSKCIREMQVNVQLLPKSLRDLASN